MWKSLVEKPVENVEKLMFSTAISPFSTSAARPDVVYTAMHNPGFGVVAGKLCSRFPGGIFLASLPKKLTLFPNGSFFGGAETMPDENFC